MSDANFRLSPEPGMGLVLELQDSEGESLEAEVEPSSLSKLDRVLRDLELGVQERWSGDADQTMKGLERDAAEFMDQILCGGRPGSRTFGLVGAGGRCSKPAI